ncbi:hypothetical protein BB050_00059 [Flavobacterium anhuiense]|uniref:Uncharacterized protein n=1 Tax=Flavobacterium anhuiense TaxID=459526 RepID=A0AAC9CWU8_9FLAO|nr:hypothetical protein BB050_00059 [Flavobacterium anhuiense]
MTIIVSFFFTHKVHIALSYYDDANFDKDYKS